MRIEPNLVRKYVVLWNTGYGNSFGIVTAKDRLDGIRKAYDLWLKEAKGDNQPIALCARYEVIGEATPELMALYKVAHEGGV